MHLGEPTEGSASILTAESAKRMREPVMAVPGLALSVGRSWFVQDIDGMRAFMHNGDTGGQHTVFLAVPEKRFALVLLVNNVSSGTAAELAALDGAFAHYPGLAPFAGKGGMNRTLLAPSGAPTVDLSAAELAGYAGQFANPGMTTTLAVGGGGLTSMTASVSQPNTWQPAVGPPLPTTPTPLTFLARDAGVLAGQRVSFVRDDADRVGWMSLGFRLVPR